MNVSEKTMAAELIPTLLGEGYLLGDEYDTNNLHDAAHQAGHQLLAPKRGKTKGLGHHRHSPYRLRSIELLKTPFGQQLFNYRKQIEREFGTLVGFGGGLTCLPSLGPWPPPSPQLGPRQTPRQRHTLVPKKRHRLASTCIIL